MNLISKIKFTDYLPYIHFLIFFLRIKKRKHIESDDITSIVSQFDFISILGSGPSLNNCEIFSNTIYFTTNSSYLYLNKETSFIHFIKDYGYLKKFLMFGLKYDPKLVVIEIYTHSDGQGFGRKSLELLNMFFGRIKFKYPVVISNNENLIKINSENYYNLRVNWLANFNIKNPDSNSGLMLYGYGLWLSNLKMKNMILNIYGLDAGEGGKKYYNNLKTPKNHVAMRDKNKIEMGDFIDNCYKKFNNINNYSYFKNNI